MSRALALALCSCIGCRFGFTEQPLVASDAADADVDAAPIDVAPDARIVTRTFGERPGSMTTGVTTDTTIDETAAATNHGLDEDLGVSAVIERGLIRFDLSSLAPGTVVVASRLELELIDFGDTITGDIALRHVGEAWVEGTVTWNERDTGMAWSTAGGTVSVPFVTAGPPPNAFTLTVPASLLQGWIDTPASNFGLALGVADEGSTTHYHLHSSESVILTARPLLAVDLAQ